MIALRLARLSVGVLAAAILLVASGMWAGDVPAAKTGALAALASMGLALLAGAIAKLQKAVRR